MKCIAIDDEPLALNVIKDFCAKISFLELEGTFTNAMDASKMLYKSEIDLIFLDIQMPNITGIEFCKSLPHFQSPLIIFTTAYTNYAIEGFELNAVDYLIKPIPFERFFKAANKAYELFGLRKGNSNIQASPIQNEPSSPDYIMIKSEYTTIKIRFDDILYIEGLKDYVKIFTGDKRHLTKSTMKNIENKLPVEKFMRVHKSYIVSLDKIEKIENNRILFGDNRIPIGDQFKKDFHLLINKFRL